MTDQRTPRAIAEQIAGVCRCDADFSACAICQKDARLADAIEAALVSAVDAQRQENKMLREKLKKLENAK